MENKSSQVRDDIVSIGLTVNVRPYKYVLGKRWHELSHITQRSVLENLERSFRTLHTGLQGTSLVTFEVCPMLGNVHMHALLKIPRHTVQYLRPYYTKHLGDQDKSKWRVIDIKYLNSDTQWFKYITKEVSIVKV